MTLAEISGLNDPAATTPRRTMKRALSILAAACILAPGAALAHTGAGGTDGVVHGLMRSVTGLDHVLAMVAAQHFS